MTTTVPVIRQVVFDSLNARRAAEFWRQLLDLAYREGHSPPPAGVDDSRGREWLNLRTTSGAPVLAFQQVDELASSTWPNSGVPQQLHLDITVPSLDDLRTSVARAIDLGATLLFDRTDDSEEPLVVLGDPDGHPFCLFVLNL
ncbi:MAG TPA: VOC family protein [Acidimicrobiales bacterium]|nr:VOC family protein [Acidimicrobiales bacterium]